MKNWMWMILAVGAVLIIKNLLIGRASKGDIKMKLDAGALVVDVRTPAEFAGGHYRGAINIPVGELSARMEQLGPDKSKPIVLYCHSGARAVSAKHTLTAAGFTDVINAGSLHHMP